MKGIEAAFKRVTALAGVIGAGWLLAYLGVPVGWLLGPLLASLALRSWMAVPTRLREAGDVVGSWLIGIMTGAVFSLEALRGGLPYVPALALLIAFTAALCLVNGWLLRRLAGVDNASAFLGTLPGAAAGIVSMAADLKVDRLMVTMLMYIRLVLVTILVPLMLKPLFGAAGEAVTSSGLPPVQADPVAGVGSLLLATAAGWMGKRLRIPSAHFMTPFLVFAVLKSVQPSFSPGLPAPCFDAGLFLLGVTTGLACDPARLRLMWRPALVQVVLVIGLVAACMGAGWVFHRMAGVDIKTAILGTAPGAREAMVALSLGTGANMELVLVMQTLRWLVILLLGPALAGWMAERNRIAVPESVYPD